MLRSSNVEYWGVKVKSYCANYGLEERRGKWSLNDLAVIAFEDVGCQAVSLSGLLPTSFGVTLHCLT
jgi:hypothetical protein